jgi:predicted permease
LDSVPLSIGGTSWDFKVERGKGDTPQTVNTDVYYVGSGFFETMGIPLARGRGFQLPADNEFAAIINENMARSLFGDADPVGREMFADKTRYTIVGVARDSKSRTLGEAPAACAYLFLEPNPENAMSFYGISIAVKTSANPAGLVRPIRNEILRLDPNLAIFNSETMDEHVSKSLLLPRICATLLGVFGGAGLALATIGLYGVMSYSVRRRTREIGIRMAIGAGRGQVLRMVLRQGLGLTAIGLAIGLSIALGLGRFTSSLLYGISGTDFLTMVTVSAVLLGTALGAVILPARRAASVEPSEALRYE